MKNAHLNKKSKVHASFIISIKINKKFAAIQKRTAKIIKQVFVTYAIWPNKTQISSRK
jgi:hypothetical protein